ncbi:MAG: c-type cytochrome [Pseudomonadota bacterium]
MTTQESDALTDVEFFQMFGLVLGALVLFTAIIMVLANVLDSGKAISTYTTQQLESRIAPVGTVRLSADDPAPAAAATSDVPTTLAEAKSPKELVDMACAACHIAGVAGAPKLDDAAAWQARLGERGMDGLIASVINGRGGMPARAGSALSDEELAAAVEYMVGS